METSIKEIKYFIVKIIVFSIFIISILYAFPFAIYYFSKDYIPVKKMVQMHLQHKEALVGFSYFGGRTVAHKMFLLEYTNPSILAFGSSRTFYIRKEFFNQSETFANIAVPRPSIGNLINLKDFILAIPDEKKERTLILLLDRRFFTERYDSSSDKNGDSFILKFSHLVGKPLRLVYLDYLAQKYSFLDLVKQSRTTNNIGLWSLIKDSGYRVDGSFKEGYQMSLPNRKELLRAEVAGRIHDIEQYNVKLLEQEKSNTFQNIADLKIILDLCKEKNINVIAFIPPDPSLITETLSSNKTAYARAQNALVSDIALVFENYKYPFFDLSDISLYGASDDEFLDMIHGGDVVYAKVILYLATHNVAFKSRVDVKGLQAMIKNHTGDFFDF